MRPQQIRQFSRFIPRKYRTLVLLLFVLLGGGAGLLLQGSCVSVADGDTLTVLGGESGTTKVRLYGIDAPERKQRYGEKATEAAAALVLYRNVTLKVMDTDHYGRSVALVTLDNGLDVNEELVKNGHAWVEPRYCTLPRCQVWRQYEAEARREGRGLWADNAPEPPWQWRKKHGR